MIKKIIIFIILLLFISYLIILVNIIVNRNSQITTKVDYLIVLGAKVEEYTPSLTLKYRLDEAIKLYENDLIEEIIVSGGQGNDEVTSEASVMKDYLINNGIDKNIIIVEDQSTSTFENFKFSKELISNQASEVKIGVVTTNFHVLRSKKLCSNIFKKECYFQSSQNYQGYLGIYSLLREPIALIKSFLFDK